MGLVLAVKAFCKALSHREEAERFVCGEKVGDQSTQDLPAKEDRSHLSFLYLMQHSGRLIDFLKEDISPYSDAQIGAAVRKVHADCGKSLEEYISIRPIFEGSEGVNISVPEGYDPSEVKVVGKVTGQAPYKGILRHKGWKAHKLSLPKKLSEFTGQVLAPAEVEIQ